MYRKMSLKKAMQAASIGLLAGGCGVGGGGSFLGLFEGLRGGAGSAPSGTSSSGVVESVIESSIVVVASGEGSIGSGEESLNGQPLNLAGLTLSVADVPVVANPEPGSLILFGSGLAAMVIRPRRRASSRRRTTPTA